ncbi:isoaspartyl peptidase/L-asparaginase [Oratosquilla oratoria]|uniref:isoaspartyl peptidase/L-asparaginase n=1 Tax=Oratosquilla oratoria TaxID=337810 RepID=UPI003F76FFA4
MKGSGRANPVVVVHGGAWAIPEKLWKRSIAGVKAAAIQGYQVLENGGSVVDAVEAGLVSLEDCPVFDAGTGSVLTYDGQVEMDAIVMEGDTMKAGAVGAVKNLRNPVKLARLVMERTPHVLLVGEGANKFGEEHNIHQVDPDELVTEYAKEELEKYKKYSKTVFSLFNKKEQQQYVSSLSDLQSCQEADTSYLKATGLHQERPWFDAARREFSPSFLHEGTERGWVTDLMKWPCCGCALSCNTASDPGQWTRCRDDSVIQELPSFHKGHETVGCAAVDVNGKVACGTSTGGITGKMPGRVGDTPCVGAGAYADGHVGAVSTTGHGEAIMKACLAMQVISHMEIGTSPEESIKKSLNRMEERIKGFGGAIAVSYTGQVAALFSTDRMPWAYVKDGELHYGIHPGEHHVEPYVT